MAGPLLFDRIRQKTNTTGTGTVTLFGSVSTFFTFETVGNGNSCYYCIAHESANEMEIGVGTYTSSGTTLSRSALISTNSNALVSFSSGQKDVFVIPTAAKLALLVQPQNANKILAGPTSGADAQPTFRSLVLADVPTNTVLLQEQQAAGTNGGTFTSGAWRTRNLNTKVQDAGSLCSLSSNQFTLSAGTYNIWASAQACSVNVHYLRLYNVTGSTELIMGQASYDASGNTANSLAVLFGRFTVAASQALELQHQCVTTNATVGFGVGGSAGIAPQVYSQVFLGKAA